MDVFGEQWHGYMDKIQANWKNTIAPQDLVLIPGDISWALHLSDAKIDLEWIHALPGTKVLLRGNHDYWWNSLKQIEKVLPPSLHIIQNNAYVWEGFVIGGARLWDTQEYSFNSFVNFTPNPKKKLTEEVDNTPESSKIFERELGRLEISLKEMNKHSGRKIVMTHYPPIGPDLAPSLTSAILERYGVEFCVFGHLHNVKPGSLLFGEKNGVTYLYTAGDYLNFNPLRVV
jgi:predicted phosphohydrolase